MFVALILSLAAAAAPDTAALRADGLGTLAGAYQDLLDAGWEGSCWSRKLTDGRTASGEEEAGSLPPFLADLPAGLRGCGLAKIGKVVFSAHSGDEPEEPA